VIIGNPDFVITILFFSELLIIEDLPILAYIRPGKSLRRFSTPIGSLVAKRNLDCDSENRR
jgi:hypothetical protein